eukprot:m.69024 g.69024  ORF g.69024 m.69024 type:complete len:375 (+) comp24034_c0_seq1:111-1235(+)
MGMFNVSVLPMLFAGLVMTVLFESTQVLAAPGVSGAKKSFYILFSDQIDSPTFPSKICQNAGVGPQGDECVDGREYSVFIASPQNMTAAHLAKVRQMVPASRIVAYWDFGDIPLKPSDPALCPFCTGHTMGDRPGRNCTTTYHCSDPEYNPFVAALNAVFPSELAIRQLFPANNSYQLAQGYPGLAGYLWTEKSATILSKFLSGWVQQIGFDGIYLDGYIQPSKREFHDSGYDYDGDGVAETAEEQAALYFAWAPAFVAMMRQALGEKAIILANSAGAVSDTSLSGLTIELEACVPTDGGEKSCGAALGGQHVATSSVNRESVSVLWLTHSESMGPAEQCAFAAKLQTEFPWVQQGTDFFDGSHIVCNDTYLVM